MTVERDLGVAGDRIRAQEASMSISELEAHWQRHLPLQKAKLDVDLDTSEIVDLIRTSHWRYCIADDYGLSDSRNKWYNLKNRSFVKAILMRREGDTHIRVSAHRDVNQVPEHQERFEFAFVLGRNSVFRNSVSVVNLVKAENITREQLVEMIGEFDERKSSIVDDSHKKINRSNTAKVELSGRWDFSSEELAVVIHGINGDIDFAKENGDQTKLERSKTAKHKLLMRAAELKRNGEDGIDIVSKQTNDGQEEVIMFLFDRKDKPVYKTRVTAAELAKDFPDFRELCGQIDKL